MNMQSFIMTKKYGDLKSKHFKAKLVPTVEGAERSESLLYNILAWEPNAATVY